MRPELLINVPLAKPLPSANNLREHWAAKAKRVKAQRQRIAMSFLMQASLVRHMRKMVLEDLTTRPVCTLTRTGPKQLDGDNLQGAFKAIRDEVAKHLALDDGSKRWTWDYVQESGPPGYRVHLEITQQLTQNEVAP